MKKVGFIDYYLDEWHANNYPEMIKAHSDGEFEVACAYGKIDSPIGGMTNKQWSEKYNIPVYDAIKEVIEKSDVLIVLSPDNPEMHEELCDEVLKCGKLVYIDKTFAPDRAAALRIFEKADKYGTKCYSSSALGFASELDDIDMSDVEVIYTEGAGDLEMYIIHQIEPVVRLINAAPKRAMFTGTVSHPSAIVEFADGKVWHMIQRNDKTWSNRYMIVNKNNHADVISVESDFFGLFIDALIKFFKTGEIQVPHERTVNVITIREALIKASKKPFEWVNL